MRTILVNLSLILIISSSILFSGCAPQPQIKILKCQAPIPVKPIRQEYASEFEYLKAIFEYTYKLETLTHLCY